MSEKRRNEFKALVKAAHDAIDEYAEDRLSGTGFWFMRGLDEMARVALNNLLMFPNEPKNAHDTGRAPDIPPNTSFKVAELGAGFNIYYNWQWWTVTEISSSDGNTVHISLKHMRDNSTTAFQIPMHASVMGEKRIDDRKDNKPINMILFCPKCHGQHIDEPQELCGIRDEASFLINLRCGLLKGHDDECNRVTVQEYQDIESRLWKNPPHKSHACQYCGYIWRPADVPTNGVFKILTKGKADSE